MAPPMQTLTLDTHYSIHRRIHAPRLSQRTGGGSSQVRRLWERPAYSFVLQDSHAIKSAAEALYGFMQYHQGDRPFWFSGNEWGNAETPLHVDYGDGTRTQFLLNNRWITTGTLQAYTDGTLASPQPSIDLPTGLLTYTTAPADQARLTASYQCVYRCVFAPDGEVLQDEEMFYAKLYRYQGIQVQELVP